MNVKDLKVVAITVTVLVYEVDILVFFPTIFGSMVGHCILQLHG